MTTFNTNDPKVRAELIADGRIWYGPPALRIKACEDIASGSVPCPDNLPDEARQMLRAYFNFTPPDPGFADDSGTSPA